MPKGNRSDALLKTYVKKHAVGVYDLENNNHGKLIELLVPSSLREFTKIRYNNPYHSRTYSQIGLTTGGETVIVKGSGAKSLYLEDEQVNPKGILKNIGLFIIKDDNTGIIDDNTGIIYADESLVLNKRQLKLMKRMGPKLYIRLNQELMNVSLK